MNKNTLIFSHLKLIINSIILTYFLSLFQLIEARLQIDEPLDIKRSFSSGSIDFNLATFGDIPYGLNMYGKIYYDADNNDSEMACKDLNTIKIEENIFSINDGNPIVMLDRGSCSFVTKTRNAQNIGAKAVIVVNNNDDYIHDIYAIDDGTGSDIKVPMMLISKSDGEKLKVFFRNKLKYINQDLKVLMKFELKKSDKINFEIIWSSTNLEIYNLLSNLQEILNSFPAESFHFYPIYYIQSHPNFVPKFRLEKGDIQKEINSPDCYANGHYCNFFDSEGLDLNVHQGQTVLMEDLRQICIFKERTQKNVTEFIEYTTSFYQNCLNITNPEFNTDCSKKAMRSLGYSEERIRVIDDCISSSFGREPESEWYKSENTLLHKEKKFLRRHHVIINPSIIVNKKLIYVRFFLKYIFLIFMYCFIDNFILYREEEPFIMF